VASIQFGSRECETRIVRRVLFLISLISPETVPTSARRPHKHITESEFGIDESIAIRILS